MVKFYDIQKHLDKYSGSYRKFSPLMMLIWNEFKNIWTCKPILRDVREWSRTVFRKVCAATLLCIAKSVGWVANDFNVSQKNTLTV